jgi:hypothetical protein
VASRNASQAIGALPKDWPEGLFRPGGSPPLLRCAIQSRKYRVTKNQGFRPGGEYHLVPASEFAAVVCPVNIMTDYLNMQFEPKEGAFLLATKEFPILRKKEILALLWIIAERRPDFTTGNQYRESLNVICGTRINHKKKLNATIMNILLKIIPLPEELSQATNREIPRAKKRFNSSLDRWNIEEGGQADESKS